MTNLLDLDTAGLAAFFAEQGEKPFRAKQVARWLHQRLTDDVGAMSDLSMSLRERVGAIAGIRGPTVIRDTTAADGTRKWLLDVGNGNAVEAVYIPEGDREGWSRSTEGDAIPERDARAATTAVDDPEDAPGRYRGTLCISSQAGCALDCAFCSTGKQGFNRNLGVAEIVGQLWHANRALLADGVSAKGRPGTSMRAGRSPGSKSASASVVDGRQRGPAHDDSVRGGQGELLPHGGKARSANGASTGAPWGQGRAPITNVVMMGMGEPLANFDNVVSALSVFLDDNAYGLSRRRVTLSTSGLVPAIDRLRDACPVALAVSLHAPNDALREQLVPINRKYPLAQLLAACVRYIERAPRDFVTFEYVMLDGINDQPAQAHELVALVRDVPCKFNLIPFNPFAGSGFRTSPRGRILAFQRILMEAGLVTTIRKTRGDDIDAACGQLAGQVQDRTRRRMRIPPVIASPAPGMR